MSEYLNTTKAAKAVGIAPTTLREWIKAHSIEIKKIKGNFAFFAHDIDMLKRVKTAKDNGSNVDIAINPSDIKHGETSGDIISTESSGLMQFQNALITSLAPLSELGHTFKDIHHQSLQAMKTITELEFELATVKNELKQAHNSIDMFKPDLERLSETILSLNTQNQILENDIKQARSLIEQKTEKNAQLSKENQAFQTATEQREKELAALKRELKLEKEKGFWAKLKG